MSAKDKVYRVFLKYPEEILKTGFVAEKAKLNYPISTILNELVDEHKIHKIAFGQWKLTPSSKKDVQKNIILTGEVKRFVEITGDTIHVVVNDGHEITKLTWDEFMDIIHRFRKESKAAKSQ